MHLQLISRSQYCNSRCLRLSWQFFPPQDLRLNIRGFFCRRFLDNSQMEFNFFDWSEPFARRPILWWRRWHAVFAFLIRTHFPSVNSVRTLQRQAIPVSLPPSDIRRQIRPQWGASAQRVVATSGPGYAPRQQGNWRWWNGWRWYPGYHPFRLPTAISRVCSKAELLRLLKTSENIAWLNRGRS